MLTVVSVGMQQALFPGVSEKVIRCILKTYIINLLLRLG